MELLHGDMPAVPVRNEINAGCQAKARRYEGKVAWREFLVLLESDS
jgi:hypothetical protein